MTSHSIHSKLYPQPHSFELLSGKHLYQEWHWIVPDSYHQKFFSVMGMLLKLYPGIKGLHKYSSTTSGRLKFVKDGSLEEQSYHLFIGKNEIEIKASNSVGFYYGLHCFGQLLNLYSNNLPCLKLSSQPRLKQRGYMLDVSRCKIPKLDQIKLLIDQLSQLHYNHFELYIEHAFAFQNHRQVWGDVSPITHDEILELDKYCKERFIELVPNLNSFGHFERWLKHQDYQHLAECPNGFTSPFGDFRPVGSVLKPNQNSLKFIDELYKEYLPLFKNEFFNVGCDETFELGQGFSKKKVSKEGLHEVYLTHLLKIHKLVKKHKRKMMFWADILIEDKNSIKKLPKDIIPLIWGYEAEHPFEEQCEILQKTKTKYWVCPGSGAWNSLIGRWDIAKKNIESAFINGSKHQANGLLLTDWGDGGHHQTWPISWPSIVFTAELSWSGVSLNDVALSKFIDSFFNNQTGDTLGNKLIKLGKIHQKLKSPIMNSNVYHHYLFLPPEKYKVTNKNLLEKNLNELLDIKNEVTGSTNLAMKELELSINLAIQGLKKQLNLNFNLCFNKNEKSQVIGDYESIWLERNRIGGLYESSNKLRGALVY